MDAMPRSLAHIVTASPVCCRPHAPPLRSLADSGTTPLWLGWASPATLKPCTTTCTPTWQVDQFQLDTEAVPCLHPRLVVPFSALSNLHRLCPAHGMPAECGVDGVKVDVQSTITMFGYDSGGPFMHPGLP